MDPSVLTACCLQEFRAIFTKTGITRFVFIVGARPRTASEALVLGLTYIHGPCLKVPRALSDLSFLLVIGTVVLLCAR